jgi:phosphate transport system substrate-binding protein
MTRIWLLAALLALPSCKKKEGASTDGKLAGTVKIDGSSTVFPISEAVAEEFKGKAPDVKVTVGLSGTGGGFKKFCAGETDISDASRPIKPTEVELCKGKGIDWIELSVAYDGLAVVVNPRNDWASDITVEELKKLWAPEAKGVVMKWSDVRAGWPDKAIKLFGPGTDSGTFDYFTEAVVGKEKASRSDYQPSEDDNTLVQGVAGDEGALGYFGLAYYEENQDKLKLLAVDDGKADNGDGPIKPSLETVMNGSYRPLSRPLFIYVSRKSLERPEVKAFVDFYLAEAKNLAKEVGYIPLTDKEYGEVKAKLGNGK